MTSDSGYGGEPNYVFGAGNKTTKPITIVATHTKTNLK